MLANRGEEDLAQILGLAGADATDGQQLRQRGRADARHVPERGIVERSGFKRLRATAAPLVLSADSDPNLLYFAGANPGHAEGDMLVCLCPLTWSNWLSLLRRMVDRRDRRAAH